MEELTCEQLMGWMDYYSLEPWGEDRADLRAGIVASTIANAHRGKGKLPFTPKQFMPEFDRKEPTEEELVSQVMMLMTAWGG